jgi:hypothetical protein
VLEKNNILYLLLLGRYECRVVYIIIYVYRPKCQVVDVCDDNPPTAQGGGAPTASLKKKEKLDNFYY